MTSERFDPFVPPESFLEKRATEYVEIERRHQDSRFGWDKDRELGLVEWLARIDRQRGQLADLVIAGGRWYGYDRRAAIKQLVQVAALARRAVAVLAREVHEAEGEHVDDGLMEMFRGDAVVSAASPGPDPEIPF